MNKGQRLYKFILGLLMPFLFLACSSKERIKIDGGTFNVDGKDVQLICGEMHYARIPHEYWRDRLKRARAMGLNTISVYVFWNFHERQPGEFDFSGQADVAEFVRLAQEEGLYVILRPGPYACAEWDFGGYPSWLLKEKDMVYRSKDPRFLEYCERYIKALGKQLAPLTVNNGGNILMVQVENEYGSYAADKEYLAALRDMIKDAGFNVPLFTCDGGGQVEAGHIDGALPTLNGVFSEDIFKIIDKYHPGGPYFVAEFYPAWFDVWGQRHSTVDYKRPAEQLDWMLGQGVSVSMYMFHGGTNFWYMNGANTAGGYRPQPTSYDYDAPLGEWGNCYPKYYAFREVIQKHLPHGTVLPEVPADNPTTTFATIELKESAPLQAAFHQTTESENVLSMEDLGVDFGYIHYQYMNVVDDNVVGSSGSPKDNIKHLQGAIRLIRRSLTDSNPALDFLNVYCLLYLNTTDTENLRHEMRDSFINGYKEFKARSEDYDDFYQKMTLFIQLMQEKNILSETRLAELNEWQQISEIQFQLDWLENFKKQYIN